MKEIEKIIAFYNQIDWSREKAALGTVVKVEGSAYRRIGARMFVSSNGQWVGGISGGCLEGDALKRAQIAILKNQSSIVVYDTTEDDPHQIGVGLGCNGRIEVLFTPIDPNDENNQIEFLKQITNKREPTILLQILSVQSSDLNIKGNFYTKERFSDLSNLLKVPLSTVQEQVNIAYRRRKSKVFKTTNEQGVTVEILAELIRPKIKLVCVGDNYDVNAVMDIAMVLGWEIHVVGKMRKLGKAIHQAAHQVYALEDADSIQMDEHTAVVLMSHDYKTDVDVLKKYIHKKIPYIGMLGPKKRMLKIQTEFDEANMGINMDTLARFHAPVGLDIGAESPEEIALSITSEIVAFFRNRAGNSLKNRKGSIHERL